MIKKVEVLAKHRSIVPCTWDNVPQFALICGINGSGKTQLLELINSVANAHGNKSNQARLTLSKPISNKTQYIPSTHQFGKLNNNSGTTSHIESRITGILNYAKEGKKNNQPFNDLIEIVENKAGKPISNLTDNEIERLIPPNYMQFLENGFNNQFISELFKSYQSKIETIQLFYLNEKDEKISEKDTYKEIGFPPPWALINEIFDKYGFSYHIKPPVRNNQYQPKFLDRHQESNEVDFSTLSSGEKIIVSLILWAYNSKLGEKNSVFLMDEFDAHLNPSMSRMFIEIVKDKLVGEYGLQIIMTSHSPSTVAFAEDDDIFWMERGKQIGRRSKKDIISDLSDGIMTFDEASPLLLALTTSTADSVIFTEGETDIIHISTAKQKLGEKLSYDIMSCNGANKLKSFLIGCPKDLINKKIIGIFDYDDEGSKCIASIKKQGNFTQINNGIYQSKSNPLAYAIILPTPHENFQKYKYCPIEFLYEKSILEGYNLIEKRNIKEINPLNVEADQFNQADFDGMSDLWFYRISENSTSKKQFANSVSSFDPSKFQNFKPLFELLKAT